MKSRESSLIPSPFLVVLFPATPGCWLPAGRCRALPSPHAGCAVRSALGMHSQPGNGPLHKPQCRLCGQGGELAPSPTALGHPCLRAWCGAERHGQMGSSQMGQIFLRKAERGEKGVKVNHGPERLEVEPVSTTFSA